MKHTDIVIRIDRKAAIFIAALLLAAAVGPRVWAEVLTLETTYPSPSGIYNYLVTTGNAGTSTQDTVLSRNAGNAILVPPSNAGGRVGIGTSSPSSKLEVVGTVTASNLQVNAVAAAGAACAPNGLVARDAAGLLLSCQSLVWKTATGGSTVGGYSFTLGGLSANGTGTYDNGTGRFSGNITCAPSLSPLCGSGGSYWCGSNAGCASAKAYNEDSNNFHGSTFLVVGVSGIPVTNVTKLW